MQGILEIGQRLGLAGTGVYSTLMFIFSLGEEVLCFASNGGENLEGRFNSRLF